MSYKQTIYNRLRQAGMTEAGALGVLGNWECESNCEPCRLQGDYSSSRMVSKDYTARVTSGAISRYVFGSDQKGYGLAQWTYVNYPTNTKGRKFDLYDFWKASGKALDDVNMQVDFALYEFKRDFPADLAKLKVTADLGDAVQTVCARFENPAIHNISARIEAADTIRKEIDLNAWEDGGDVLEPEPQKDELVLRVIDQNCNGFNEVYLLQSLLLCRGYEVIVSGVWDFELTECVKVFQRHNGLDDDGVVGKLTWNKLMERKGG